jgi:hypothetical protein
MLAAVIALIALVGVVATAMAGRSRLTAQRRTLDAYAARLADRENKVQALQQEISYARKDLMAAKEQLVVSREDADAETARYARCIRDLRPAADARFTLADSDAVQAAQRLAELEQYVVRSLEHDTAAGPRSRVLRGSLFARQSAVLDLVPELADELLAKLAACVIFRQPDGPNGCRWYLRWPANAPAPELALGSLLRAATSVADPAGEEPGIAQLRGLLAALQESGPAVLNLGPLIVSRTAARLSAGLAPADWPGLTGIHTAAAIEGIGPDLLRSIGASGVVDLTEWPVSV